MKKRAKVLSEPNEGFCLLMMDGRQYQFSLNVWRPETPPRPGLVVDVDRDQNLRIVSITAVSESQINESQLNKERAEAAVSKAKEKGGQIFSQVAEKCGTANLVAAGLLVIGWLLLTTLSIQVPVLGSIKFSFWGVLGLLNASNLLESMSQGLRPGAGIYGLFALIALAGPFIYHVWKDKRAVLGGLAPLLFMLIVWILARHSLHSAFGGNLAGADGELARQAMEEAMQGVSFGFGAYLSFLVSLYFAGAAIKRFLQGRAADAPVPASSSRAVA